MVYTAHRHPAVTVIRPTTTGIQHLMERSHLFIYTALVSTSRQIAMKSVHEKDRYSSLTNEPWRIQWVEHVEWNLVQTHPVNINMQVFPFVFSSLFLSNMGYGTVKMVVGSGSMHHPEWYGWNPVGFFGRSSFWHYHSGPLFQHLHYLAYDHRGSRGVEDGWKSTGGIVRPYLA